MTEIVARQLQLPCGKLLIASYGDELCLCDWLNNPRHERNVRRLENTLGSRLIVGNSHVLSQLEKQLGEYFMGSRCRFDIPMLLVGTPFQQTVWQYLAQIPFGQTVSYAQEAEVLGCPAAVRAVAQANAANPLSIVLPCHRVVGSNGQLGGYAGGVGAKQYLLQHEKALCLDSLI